MLDNFPAGQVEHLTQGIVVGEAGLVFCDLAKRTVQALNNIRRVYDFPNLGGICEKDTQNIPVFLPAFDAGGVLLPPLFFECHGIFQSLILGDSGVNLLQIRHQWLDVLITDKAGEGADLMDDAPLHLAVGISSPNGFHEAS